MDKRFVARPPGVVVLPRLHWGFVTSPMFTFVLNNAKPITHHLYWHKLYDRAAQLNEIRYLWRSAIIKLLIYLNK